LVVGGEFGNPNTKLNVRSWQRIELHVIKLLAVKRTVLTVSIWPVADIPQPEKSLIPYRSFRVLIFQRVHRQHPT